MKIKLTPELSYIIGLWRKARTQEGIGVKGNEDVLAIFSKEVIDKELTTPDKIQSEEDRIFFYHTSYRKFFQQIEKEQLERFKYLNEYAANYLAGMFDSSGEIDEKGIVSLGNVSSRDEMMLLRLGFVIRRRNKRAILEKPLLFLTFIKNYVKVYGGHSVFSLIKAKPVRKSSR
jgi:hypothetical protein